MDVTVRVCRKSQIRVLRQFAIDKIGCEIAAKLSDEDIVLWLEDEGYQSYIEYTGEYDDSDGILIAKSSDIQRLVDGGEAFWSTRSGVLERGR